jgi:hypothetical protein
MQRKVLKNKINSIINNHCMNEMQPSINTNASTAINPKEELINNIREWIKLDNDILKMKNEMKQKNAKKKELTENLVKVMKSNSIDCFDVNGGALIYKQKKTKKSISGKFLLEELQKYYKEQPELGKEIAQYVLDNRPEVVKDELKRKIVQ